MSVVHASGLRRLRLTDAAVELSKWLALLCMLVDHVNAVFLQRDGGLLVDVLGRLSMPLFAVVMAYNLARPGACHVRTLRRLVIFGVIALPAHAYLFGLVGPWPLNILWTFAVAVGVIVLIEQGSRCEAAVVFLLGSCLVEYWHAGTGLVLALWWLFRGGRHGELLAAAAMAALCLVNGNLWALAAIPLLLALNGAGCHVPRSRWLFWAFYPAHLYVLAQLTL